jgi:hypothetical protein
MRNHLLLVAALGLGLCASGVAWAQSYGQPSPYPVPGADAFHSSQATLMNQAQKSVDSANANIAALNNVAQGQTGAAKKKTGDVASSLTKQRDKVQSDIGQMSKATVSDWGGIQQSAMKDLAALNGQLKNAASITRLPVPSM